MISLRKGITLIETMIVLVIVVLLAGLLVPVMSNAKWSSLEAKCIVQLRQLQNSLSLYRQDWETGQGPLFHSLGLPTSVWLMEDGQDFPLGIRKSPFPPDPTISETAVINVAGEITFATNFYQPKALQAGNANYIELNGYLEEYGEGALAMFDPYCNARGTDMRQPMLRKRVLGITIGGQLLRHHTYNQLGLNFRAYHK